MKQPNAKKTPKASKRLLSAMIAASLAATGSAAAVEFDTGNPDLVMRWDNTFRAIDAATGNVAWEKKIGHDKNGKISFYYSPAISSPALKGLAAKWASVAESAMSANARPSGVSVLAAGT